MIYFSLFMTASAKEYIHELAKADRQRVTAYISRRILHLHVCARRVLQAACPRLLHKVGLST